MKAEAGYERGLAIGYLDSIGTRRPDGKFFELNEIRVTDNHRMMIQRWEQLDVVPLGRFDTILMTYGSMLWEYEHWAHEQYERDGFVAAETLAA